MGSLRTLQKKDPEEEKIEDPEFDEEDWVSFGPKEEDWKPIRTKLVFIEKFKLNLEPYNPED